MTCNLSAQPLVHTLSVRAMGADESLVDPGTKLKVLSPDGQFLGQFDTPFRIEGSYQLFLSGL